MEGLDFSRLSSSLPVDGSQIEDDLSHLEIHRKIRSLAKDVKMFRVRLQSFGLETSRFSSEIRRAKVLIVAHCCERALYELEDLRTTLLGYLVGQEIDSFDLEVRSASPKVLVRVGAPEQPGGRGSTSLTTRGSATLRTMRKTPKKGPSSRAAFVAISLMLVLSVISVGFVDTVEAHASGVSLSAFKATPPLIDGSIVFPEWSNSGSINFFTQQADTSGTMYVMNDASNLYIALQITDANPPSSLFFHFDDNHDGVLAVGEDVLIPVGNPDLDHFMTDVSSTATGAGPDVPNGGSPDGVAAHARVGTSNSFEISHPLCSGDVRDFCLQPGETVGFEIVYCCISGQTALWPDLWTTPLFDASGWGDITIASGPALPAQIQELKADAIQTLEFLDNTIVEGTFIVEREITNIELSVAIESAVSALPPAPRNAIRDFVGQQIVAKALTKLEGIGLEDLVRNHGLRNVYLASVREQLHTAISEVRTLDFPAGRPLTTADTEFIQRVRLMLQLLREQGISKLTWLDAYIDALESRSLTESIAITLFIAEIGLLLFPLTSAAAVAAFVTTGGIVQLARTAWTGVRDIRVLQTQLLGWLYETSIDVQDVLEAVMVLRTRLDTSQPAYPQVSFERRFGFDYLVSETGATIFVKNIHDEPLGLKAFAKVTMRLGPEFFDQTIIGEVWRSAAIHSQPALLSAGQSGNLFVEYPQALRDWLRLVKSVALGGNPLKVTVGFDVFVAYGEFPSMVAAQRKFFSYTYVFARQQTTLLEVSAFSPVNILLTDPIGRRVGFDPVTGTELIEIPGSTYTGPSAEPQTILVPEPVEGEYGVSSIGVAGGSFVIVVTMIGEAGMVVAQFELDGVAAPGSEASLRFRNVPLQTDEVLATIGLEVESLRDRVSATEIAKRIREKLLKLLVSSLNKITEASKLWQNLQGREDDDRLDDIKDLLADASDRIAEFVEELHEKTKGGKIPVQLAGDLVARAEKISQDLGFALALFDEGDDDDAEDDD